MLLRKGAKPSALCSYRDKLELELEENESQGKQETR